MEAICGGREAQMSEFLSNIWAPQNKYFRYLFGYRMAGWLPRSGLLPCGRSKKTLLDTKQFFLWKQLWWASPVPLGCCWIASMQGWSWQYANSCCFLRGARIPLETKLTLANFCCFGCWPRLLYLEVCRGTRMLGNYDEIRVIAIKIHG